MWPIVAMNASLPPNIRFKRKHMFLVGLWVGSGKPYMKTFLKPFISEFNECYKHGMFLFCNISQSRI